MDKFPYTWMTKQLFHSYQYETQPCTIVTFNQQMELSRLYYNLMAFSKPWMIIIHINSFRFFIHQFIKIADRSDLDIVEIWWLSIKWLWQYVDYWSVNRQSLQKRLLTLLNYKWVKLGLCLSRSNYVFKLGTNVIKVISGHELTVDQDIQTVSVINQFISIAPDTSVSNWFCNMLTLSLEIKSLTECCLLSCFTVLFNFYRIFSAFVSDWVKDLCMLNY